MKKKSKLDLSSLLGGKDSAKPTVKKKTSNPLLEVKKKAKKVTASPDTERPAPVKKVKTSVEDAAVSLVKKKKTVKSSLAKIELVSPSASSDRVPSGKRKLEVTPEETKITGSKANLHREVVKSTKDLAPLYTDEPTPQELVKIKKAKQQLKHLQGTFKKFVPEAHMLLGREEMNTTSQLIQRAMLVMLLDSLPLLENEFRKKPTQSMTFSMQAMVNTAREILNEIEAKDDGSKLLEALVGEVLLPSFRDIGQHLVLALYHLKNQVMGTVPDAKRDYVGQQVDAVANDIRVFLGTKFADIQSRVSEKVKQ